MTDHPETSSRYRLPWRRDQMMQGGRLGSALRVIPRNPVLLIGAAVLGIVGVLAWRNRDRIAEKAAPLIEDAKVKGQELIDEARFRGQELIDDAKAATQALGEKASRARRAASQKTTPELH
jgi:hypothetical protein